MSPIAIFVSSAFGDEYSSYGVAVLLIIVAVAVFLFVYYGNIRGAYQRLLKTGDFSEEKQEEKKEEDRIVGAVAAIIWPLVTCVFFLVSGFVFDQWEINWIVFPLTGILFGVFSSVYNMFKKKRCCLSLLYTICHTTLIKKGDIAHVPSLRIGGNMKAFIPLMITVQEPVPG
ncbi:hypothetical protein ACFSQ7_49680 [Paenibacillus rhizoplanae]